MEFPLPLDVTTDIKDAGGVSLTADPGDGLVHIDEGDTFNVDLQLTVPISEAFIAGVLVQVPTLTNFDVDRVFVSIPTPAGATGPDLDVTYAPGNVIIATDPGGGLPLVPVPGGVQLPSPTFSFGPFTATAPGGTSIDFNLDPALPGSPEAVAAGGTVFGAGGVAAAIELDLTILAVVAVGFDCQDGGLTQYAGPDGIGAIDPLAASGDPGNAIADPVAYALLPDTGQTADDFFSAPVIPNTPFNEIAVDLPATPTVQVSGVTGQSVTDAARATNTLTFGGGNWAAGTVTGIELCDLALTSCDATGLTGASASIAGGTLSGTATVDASATTGARALVVTSSTGETDDTPILILGTPTITAPGNAGLGSPITVTGTNWNPGSATTGIQFLDATDPLAPIVLGGGVAVPDATGNFTFNSTVVAGMNLIGAGDQDPFYPQPPSPSVPGSLFALSPFAVSANGCTVPGSGAWATGGPTGQDCSIEQTVLLEVLPGTLSMSQQAGIIDLGSLQLNGQSQFVPGAINEITTIDATGSLFGWDLTATMTDLDANGGGGNNTILAGDMEWTPSCAPIDANGDTIVDGNPAEVSSGPVADMDNTVGNTLCTAAAGGGGGTFANNASLNLFVPANVAAGDYQGTMTFLLM